MDIGKGIQNKGNKLEDDKLLDILCKHLFAFEQPVTKNVKGSLPIILVNK